MNNTRNWLCLFSWALACVVSSCTMPMHAPPTEPADTVGRILAVASMNTPRAVHTATLLPNGDVLVAGGFNGSESALASAELFDPTTDMFAPTSPLTTARQSHTATLLPNGKVLIAGGFNGHYLDSAEVYDPATGTFAPTGSMRVARSGHTATLLRNGQVLVVGGTGVGWTFLDSAEVYDPATSTFALTGAMTQARESHTATLLADGRVLVTGGHSGRRQSMVVYASAELYDPATGAFAAAGAMTHIRHKHDATLLANGTVLIIGGADQRDGDGAYTSAEIYDPATSSFTPTSAMHAARYKIFGTSLLLPDDRVLVAGGAPSMEVFDPITQTFSAATGTTETTRLFATATLLQNGDVLVAGGYGAGVAAHAAAWLYRSTQ